VSRRIQLNRDFPEAGPAVFRERWGFADGPRVSGKSAAFWLKVDNMAGRRVLVARGRRRIAVAISSSLQPASQAPAAVVSRRRQQQLRRQNSRARVNVVRVIASLLRLGVLPLSTVSQATDVARLTLLADALRRQKLPEEVVVGILMLDWAARAPELTADFMETLHRRGARLRKQRPEMVLTLYTKAATQRDWRTFWHGPTRIHTERFLNTVSPASLLAVGARLSVPRIRGSAVLAYVQSLPHMGPYTALSLVRAVAAGAGKRMRDCRRAAIGMSFHTRMLASALPFVDAARELRQITGEQYEENLLAFFYCETIKILRHESVLEPLHRYDDAPGRFAAHLASIRCKRLADTMEGMVSVEVVGGSETELLNRVCPGAKRMRHSSTDVVRRWREVKATSL